MRFATLTASFYEAPHVNPKALDLHSLIQSVGVLPALSAGGVSTVSSAADRQRVDYRASLCVPSSHSTQRPVSIRVGTAGASTTFYPCRLAAGHLISHAPLGAGDTSNQYAPSTKSVRLATRMRYGHILGSAPLADVPIPGPSWLWGPLPSNNITASRRAKKSLPIGSRIPSPEPVAMAHAFSE